MGTPELHFANPIEPFFTYRKVALMVRCFGAAPVIFYQLWSFVAPGLYHNERRYIMPFTVLSAVFFLGGACFGYFVIFPYAFRFFLGFARTNLSSLQNVFGNSVSLTVGQPITLKATLMMEEYFGLVWRLLAAFGLVFELPLVIAILAVIGVVDHRFLWKANRYFVVLAFIIAGVITPPDVITQTSVALPLIVLYNLSIVLAWAIGKRRKAAAKRGAS
jgi:sec-independent protein translocase protein TatC